MAHHQDIGVHGVERHRRVDQRLALAHRTDRHGHVDDVGAEPLTRYLERGPSAGRILEKTIDYGATPQQRALLFGLTVEVDITIREIENLVDVLLGQALNAE